MDHRCLQFPKESEALGFSFQLSYYFRISNSGSRIAVLVHLAKTGCGPERSYHPLLYICFPIRLAQ
jgi:hypothetical protein